MYSPVRTQLSNGMRIILVPMSQCSTVTIYVTAKAGTFYETKENNGISHFTEHLGFVGTTNRPHVQEILAELDGISKDSNANTDYDLTSYYLTTLASDVNLAIDLMSDLFTNQTFPREYMEVERRVVLGEIDMVEDDPPSKLDDLLPEVMYGNQPAGWPILGPKENVQSFEQADFLAYRDKNYTIDTSTVVIAGSIHIAEALEVLDGSHFGAVRRRSSRAVMIPPQRACNTLQLGVFPKDTGQTHVSLGFEVSPQTYEDRIVALVLHEFLSGGWSTRIFQRMRTELGLGYYASGSFQDFGGHGVYSAKAGIDNERVVEGVRELVRVLLTMGRVQVPDQELRLAQKIAEIHLTFEETSDAAKFFCLREARGLPMVSPEQVVKDLKQVTPEDVLRFASTYFRTEKLSVALIGPEPKGDLRKILSSL